MNDFQEEKMATCSNQSIKIGLWIYFLLLILEGALRKWVFPGLSSPLLIIRDPVAFWLIIMAIRNGIFPASSALTGMVLIGIIATFTSIFWGHGNLAVSLFGARILLLHFPVIFIIGQVFKLEDVIKMGKIILWISLPMTVLVALQFYSPQSAWVNRGVGGDMAGGGFSGANGFFRPPGTFSFITGVVAFYSLCACFIVYFWMSQKGINRFLLFAATTALLMVIPLSISRSLFFGVALTLLFTGLAIARNTEYLGKLIVGSVGVFAIFALVGNTEIFKTATEAFSSRFETASEHEGGLEGVLIDRFFGGLWHALSSAFEQPVFGYGQGLGTNVGSQITTGKMGFMIAEGEWGRLIGEYGPLMGLMTIFFRLKLSAQIALASYQKMVEGNILPWVLLSIVLLNIPQGQWAQPSSLGFAVLAAGLTMASLKSNPDETTG
jgi:hypothetical protein